MLTEYPPAAGTSAFVGTCLSNWNRPATIAPPGDGLTICGTTYAGTRATLIVTEYGFTFDGPPEEVRTNPGKAVFEIDQRPTEQKPAQQEFANITKAKDLVKHTFMMTSERRFPKKYRFTIVNRLHDLTLDIFQHIQEANELDLTDPQEYRERRYEQKKALTECKTVLFLIELSFEKELISSEQCAEWTRARYEREEHDGKVEEAR